MTSRNPKRRPTHPGALLREDVLPAIGKSKAEIAHALNISRQTLYDILNENQPITPEMAVRIGKLCGNGPRLWLSMQTAHDLWLAEQSVSVDDIPTLAEAI